MKKTILAIAVLSILFLPFFASAAELPSVWDPGSIKGPLVSCTGSPYLADGKTENPNMCKNLCDLVFTIVKDLYVIMAFVIWIVLPFSFIVGGIMYMLGGANPDLLSSAKSTLKGAVIGALIVLCAYLLVATFVQFMKISKIGGFSPDTPSICSF